MLSDSEKLKSKNEKSKYQILVCGDCGMRFPNTNGALGGVLKCVICGGKVDVVEEYGGKEKLKVKSHKLNVGNFKIEVILDNIRSAWNVGSILRTCDAAGVSKVWVCGISPTPENEKVLKTSLGAEKMVEWEYAKNALSLVESLKVEGSEVWAMEKCERSESIFSMNNEQLSMNNEQLSMNNKVGINKIVLVLGHEVGGVDPGILRVVDKVVHLPMYGEKESLNVAVAAGVGIYEVVRMMEE